MADTQMLRTSAIQRNASVGAQPPHGAVKTGELPLVQVKMTPSGPQIQEGQQSPVTILPPRDAKAAVTTGGLPLVQIKMTQNGPQLDDGRDQTVVVKDAKHSAVAAGGLPMLQVKMTQAGPQVQTLPNLHGAPPQIPSAAPALSAPRAAASVGARVVPAPGGPYVAHVTRVPIRGGQPASRVGAPVRQLQAALPPIPEMSTEQLMLCRHLADKYLGEQRATEAASAEASAIAAHVINLAEEMIVTIDQMMVATAIRDEAAAKAAAATTVPAAPRVVAAAASASIAPAPSVSYVAGRVGALGARPASVPAARPPGYTGARVQRNSGMAPRRMARSGAPGASLPPVIVKMDGGQPIVQNRTVLEQAPAEAQVDEVAPGNEIQSPVMPEVQVMEVPAGPSPEAPVQG